MHSLKIGVIFGGRSGEHEVSLKSACSVIKTLLESDYEVVPIGITKKGEWIIGSGAIPELVKLADETLIEGIGDMALDINKAINKSGSRTIEMYSGMLIPDAGVFRFVDVVFPVLHGPFGEDGTVQGLLELAQIPYIGCGVTASCVGMDKIIFKDIMRTHGIPTPGYIFTTRDRLEKESDGIIEQVNERLRWPVFCKPANLGSSVGITLCKSEVRLSEALEMASRYDRRIIIEEAVPYAREIEVSVLGNEEPEASVPGEIIPSREFYDYQAKYIDKGEDASKLIIPAELDEAVLSRCRDIAIRAFKAIDGAGMARVDFLLNGGDGELYINEINTIPGFTNISMYAKLWEASGVSYSDLLDKLITLALERFEDKKRNKIM